MSWKPEFFFKNDGKPHEQVDHGGERGKWCQNGQAFATEQEAKSSAFNRFCKEKLYIASSMVFMGITKRRPNWTVPHDYRAVESTQLVNYRWDHELGDVSLACTSVLAE